MNGTTSRTFTGEQIDEIAKKYRAGATVTELAAEYAVSTAPIRNALRMRGLNARSRGAGHSLNRRIS